MSEELEHKIFLYSQNELHENEVAEVENLINSSTEAMEIYNSFLSLEKDVVDYYAKINPITVEKVKIRNSKPIIKYFSAAAALVAISLMVNNYTVFKSCLKEKSAIDMAKIDEINNKDWNLEFFTLEQELRNIQKTITSELKKGATQ